MLSYACRFWIGERKGGGDTIHVGTVILVYLLLYLWTEMRPFYVIKACSWFLRLHVLYFSA